MARDVVRNRRDSSAAAAAAVGGMLRWRTSLSTPVARITHTHHVRQSDGKLGKYAATPPREGGEQNDVSACRAAVASICNLLVSCTPHIAESQSHHDQLGNRGPAGV